MIQPNFKMPLTIGSAVLLTVTLGAFAFLPHTPKPVAEAPKHTAAAPVSTILTLATAVRDGHVSIECVGNGKDHLALTIHNTSGQPLRLRLAAGQLFQSAKATVALVRAQEIPVEPNARKTEDLPTIATTSANETGSATYNLSTDTIPRLDTLFTYLDEHPEVAFAPAQTAALALTENLPLSAFAKFNVIDSASRARVATTTFQTDTCDIVAALLVLRDLGLDDRLLINAEPQLKIEAMIDPLAHASAIRYYGITDDWGYWKNELSYGNPATRHYALFGIARFYPDIALQMLPKWARSLGTSPVFRTSAINALAETQRPEALILLRQLTGEFGSGTDLGKSAEIAANCLDAQFTKAPIAKPAIAFHASKNLAAQKASLATN